MPGLVPGIHVLYGISESEGVDGRVKPGHDGFAAPRPGHATHTPTVSANPTAHNANA